MSKRFDHCAHKNLRTNYYADGSDSKEQEHLLPLGYARTDSKEQNRIVADGMYRTVEG